MSEYLKYSKKGSHSLFVDAFQNFDHPFLTAFHGQDELILQKSIFPISFVPVVDFIQWIEKRIVGHNGMQLFFHVIVVIQKVESFYRILIQQKRRKIYR